VSLVCLGSLSLSYGQSVIALPRYVTTAERGDGFVQLADHLLAK